jgi:hypothetical protein
VIFLVTATALIALASVLLRVSIGFGFAAGEIMTSPSAHAADRVKLEHAANFALSLFAAAQVALALLILKAGSVRIRWLLALKAVGVFVAGVLVSYLLFRFVFLPWGLPRPLAEVDRAISVWIERVV